MARVVTVAYLQKLHVPYLCSRRVGIAGVVEQTQKRQVIEMLVNWLSTSMQLPLAQLHDCSFTEGDTALPLC